ncbi:MAG: hypothetical protein P8X64_09935 [Anaerolineales bacterium]|jgi:hypothetical protein
MSVSTAFQDLSAALQSALEQAKSSGAQAFQAGEFEAAQQAADQGVQVQAMIEAVAELAARWEGVNSSPGSAEQEIWDVQVGSNGKEEELIFPVLYVLDQLGGNAHASETLDRVEQLLQEKLTSDEFGELSEAWGGPLRGMMESLEKQMVRRGVIHIKGKPGNWNLTPQGRMTLMEQQG